MANAWLESLKDWQFGLADAADIAVVATVVYFFLRLIRGTRAVQMLIGVAMVVIIYELARVFGLFTVEWLFGHFFSSFIVILVVLFQQEIRRALVSVAVNPLAQSPAPVHTMVAILVESAFVLAHRGWGGLIVLERETGLRHLYDSGVEMDAPLRPDLIQALFCPDAPMHDGAVIVRSDERGGRIVAARVLLPLAQATALPGDFGTRHRAAVGLSEESDALIIVVSEETGEVHLVEKGRLGEALGSQQLHQALVERLAAMPVKKTPA